MCLSVYGVVKLFECSQDLLDKIRLSKRPIFGEFGLVKMFGVMGVVCWVICEILEPDACQLSKYWSWILQSRSGMTSTRSISFSSQF